MYLTDPIADMLTRIRNANAVMHEKVDVPHSNLKDRLVNVVLPRVRDFEGVSADSFDGRGNYSVGLRD